jgi:hypothetical protein
MRNVFLYSLPVTLIAAVGCGSQEQAARSDLERDLTLVTGPSMRALTAADRPVASAIELRQFPTQPGAGVSVHKAVQSRKAARRTARHLTPKAAEPVRPTTIQRPAIADVVVPNPGTQPVTAVPADSRELPAGKTVSVIPVSSGPSPSGERGTEDIPLAGTGGSGMGGTGGSGMGGGRRERGMVY